MDLTYINKYFRDGVWDEESLKKEFIVKKKDEYLLIKYKKHNLDKENVKNIGLFRSVILNKNKIVCISPPKSLPYDEKKNYKLYEFVEGTMINIWYDETNNNWRISSKSIIDAENRFYDNQSLFCEMFYECCNNSKLNFDILNKDHCYSFIFQHPNNRLINVVYEPSLYLIAAYKNNNNNTFEKVSYNDLYYITYKTDVKLPSSYVYPINDIIYKTIHNGLPLSNMGFVLSEDNSVYHTKVRNKNYEIIKKFKMNNSKLVDTFLNLKRKKMDGMYVKLFPEHIAEFNNYLNKYISLINNLYSLYYDINVVKSLELSELDNILKINLRNIHSYYIQNLREKNMKVSKYHIDEYLMNLKNHIIISLMNLHIF